MTNKKWFITFTVSASILAAIIIGAIAYVDPFFHYHAPVDALVYPLNNQRSQNDGIIRHFTYDAMITGTSMTENFNTSEAESIFGLRFIKVPFSGGSFKEINENIQSALKRNPKLLVIRGIDLGMIGQPKDTMRYELGSFPTYLYDENPLNDVFYVLNKHVFLNYSVPALQQYLLGKPGVITSFDKYSNWMSSHTFGKESVLTKINSFTQPDFERVLSAGEEIQARENIIQNVTLLPKLYPETMFYHFFTPYSVAWWGLQNQEGKLRYNIELQKIAIEEMLKYPNIRLYSFNNMFGVTGDLNNYKDSTHYGEWINTNILQWMKEGTGLLTPDNYKANLDELYQYYSTFNYQTLFDSPDDPKR